MANFDRTQWSDFVRGLIDGETRERMQAHLDSPSGVEARRQVAALERVVALAETDRELRIPAHAERAVKALGSLRRPAAAERPSLLDRIRLGLAFDSFLEPAVAGVRDLQPADRQLVFEDAGYTVELRLEVAHGGRSAVVVGQVVKGREEAVGGVPVLATQGDRVVGRALTGELGEFQAEDLPTGPLNFLFLVDDGYCLEVSLEDQQP